MITALLLFAQLSQTTGPESSPPSGIQFDATVSPATVYVGQQVSYDAIIRVAPSPRTQFRSDPTYTPPDVRGVRMYDFPFDAKAVRDVTIDGVAFREYVYHRALFPLLTGNFTIPPASLQFVLPNQTDPFEAPVSYLLHGPARQFVARPLPDVGRSADFTGAVGRFTIAAAVESSTVRVGEPFIMTVTVTGTGNVDLLPRPRLALDWASLVKSTERAHWDSTGTVVQGTKSFQWIVNPHTAGRAVIPAVQYNYFNPESQRYETAVSIPIPVTISAAASGGGAGTNDDVLHDTLATTPFPLLVRTLREHWVPALVVVAVLVAGILVLVVRGVPDDHGDPLE